MKSLLTFINESDNMYGGCFKEHVKYTLSDFKQWCTAAGDHYEFYTDNEFTLIYEKLNKKDSNGSTIKHIATYNSKKELLSCDDINLFGHEF